MIGWLGRRHHDKALAAMASPVSGELKVTSMSAPPGGGESVMFCSGTLVGVVSADGVQPTAVRQEGMFRVRTWPAVGAVLPVTLDQGDPTRFVIEWEQVPSTADLAMATAEREAIHEQTNLDFSVLSSASRPAPLPSPSGPAPLSSASRPVDTAAPVAGTVIAVNPVSVPAGLAPAGGVWDLTVRAGERSYLVRARCETGDERLAVAAIGASVRVVPSGASPDVASLVV